MRVYLATPQRAPYSGFDFLGWFGGEYYRQRLDQFCSELVDLEFNGSTWQIEPDHEGRLVAWARRLQMFSQYLQGKPVVPFRLTLPRSHLKVVRYFPDRGRLMALCAAFVDDLFMRVAHENGKQTWCEETPHTRLHLDFMLELFPQAAFIHIKRDPRGVIHSMTKQHWAPNDVKGACLFLKNVYSRWFDLKRTLDLTKCRYFELKLENLATSPQAVLEEVLFFCGLENRYENPPQIKVDRVNNWQEMMSKQEVQLVNAILGPYIEQMGYEV
jgi:hypothetical protein